MFTGLIQGIGSIQGIRPTAQAASASSAKGAGLHLTIAFGSLDAGDVNVGDSIAINGACMTVVARSTTEFEVDVSRESLDRTAGFDREGPVNLEKSLRAGDRLGGHLVSGHIDGVGRVVSVMPAGESWRLDIECPAALSAYVCDKGSVAINGVSLTINSVQDRSSGTVISINIIPHTWRETTLAHLLPDAKVNIEVDQMAKQVERILERLKQD